MDYDEAYGAYRLDYNTGFDGDFTDWMAHHDLEECVFCGQIVANAERLTQGPFAKMYACSACITHNNTSEHTTEATR